MECVDEWLQRQANDMSVFRNANEVLGYFWTWAWGPLEYGLTVTSRTSRAFESPSAVTVQGNCFFQVLQNSVAGCNLTES